MLLKGQDVKPLFDSKGSLMDSESFVKDKIKEYKDKRAAITIMIKDLQDKVKEFKEVNAQ